MGGGVGFIVMDAQGAIQPPLIGPGQGQTSRNQHQQHGDGPGPRIVGMIRQVVVPTFPGENSQPPAEHVGRGQQAAGGGQGQGPPGFMGQGSGENRVLAVEPAHQGRTDDRQHAGQAGQGGQRHLLRQAAQPLEILDPVTAMDHRSRAKEQQAFENRVGEQVGDARGQGAAAQGDKHQAQLADRAVGQHRLEIPLDTGDGGGQQAGDAPGPGHHGEGLMGEQRIGPGHQEHPRRHHGRGVDDGGGRGRALHRIWQPRVQGKLGALAHRTAEHAQGCQGQQGLGAEAEQTAGQTVARHQGGEIRPLQRFLGVAHLADRRGEEQGDAGDEAGIPDPVHDERFELGVGRAQTGFIDAPTQGILALLIVGVVRHRRPLPPEADEQVTAQANQFPGQEGHQ